MDLVKQCQVCNEIDMSLQVTVSQSYRHSCTLKNFSLAYCTSTVNQLSKLGGFRLGFSLPVTTKLNRQGPFHDTLFKLRPFFNRNSVTVTLEGLSSHFRVGHAGPGPGDRTGTPPVTVAEGVLRRKRRKRET
eukprot:751533-Hanusia_phi.AAC.1